MDETTRAYVGFLLGHISAAVGQLAEQQAFGVVDWEADMSAEKPWSTVIFADGTRVRITAEVEDVSNPAIALGFPRDPNKEVGMPGGGFDASDEVEWH